MSSGTARPRRAGWRMSGGGPKRNSRPPSATSGAEQPPELGVLAGLADGDQGVAALDRVARLGARDGLGLAQDGDHRDAGLRAEATVGEPLADRRAVVGDPDPLDLELAERHLEVLDDFRPLVGAADDGSALARLAVVEGDHRLRLL